MNKFRRPPITPEDFVRGAATARDLLPQDETPAMIPAPTSQAARASEHETALEPLQEPQKPKQESREVELISTPAETLDKPSKTRITKSVAFTMPEAPPELSARVQKQINFDMPETEHWVLKQLVDRTPAMSLRKFYLAAVREKMEQMLSDEQAKIIGKGP